MTGSRGRVRMIRAALSRRWRKQVFRMTTDVRADLCRDVDFGEQFLPDQVNLESRNGDEQNSG